MPRKPGPVRPILPASTSRAPGRDPALDGLRGVAVLLVFFFHYGGGLRAHNPALRFLGYVSQAGWAGVDLFFALSGYLITAQLLAEPRPQHDLRNFYLRRALRILPLYYVALAACALAALAAGTGVGQLRPLLVYVAFLQNLPSLVPVAAHTPPPLPVFHLWSLAVEVQFYLLWPLLLWAIPARRAGTWMSLALFALSCVFRAVLFGSPLISARFAQDAAVSLPTRAGALALGAALAFVSPLLSARSLRSVSTTSLLAGGACWLFLGYRTGSFLLRGAPAFRFALPAVDLLSAALVALCLLPGTFRTHLAWRPLAALGQISYGFYIFHILCEPLFDHLGVLLTHQSSGFAYQAARLAAALPITTVLATLSFHVVEQPFLRLKRRLPLQEPPTRLAAPDL